MKRKDVLSWLAFWLAIILLVFLYVFMILHAWRTIKENPNWNRIEYRQTESIQSLRLSDGD